MNEGERGLSNFNSIKVRLKHSALKVKRNTVKFQFHKGTINTYVELFVKNVDRISIP